MDQIVRRKWRMTRSAPDLRPCAHYTWGVWFETEVFLWKRIKCFASTLHRGNLNHNNHRSLDVCFRKTQAGVRGGGSGKSNHYLRDAIVFKKLSFQNDLRPHENAKLRIHVPPVWKSVFKKLCFRNGLVWTVRLTVEIKLCFRIFPPKGGSCCNCKDSSTEDGKCFRKISYFWSKTSGLRDWHWACNFKAFVSDSVYDRAVASLASEEQRRSVRLNCCVAFE